LATRKNVAEAFDKKLTTLGRQNARTLAETATRARAAEVLTGTPAHLTIDPLKAQQAAQVGRMNKNYNAAARQMSSSHAAAEAADAAGFARRMKTRSRGLGALGLLLRYGPMAAGYAGGTQVPAALSPTTPETK
jgi:hypothetical protein